jgi:hypothetical protein
MAAPVGDGGGVMPPSGVAMAPTPARQPEGYNEPFSMRSSPTGRHGMTNSPKGVLGGSGDRSSACDGGRLAPIFGDGGSSR